MITLMLALGCGNPKSTETVPVPMVEPPVTQESITFSPVYHIDQIYRSMQGPSAFQEVWLLPPTEPPELLWITGYKSVVVNDSGEDISQEFMCHANLDFDPTQYYELMESRVPVSGRIFTLSQGQQDIQFPDGFGVPILSSQPLRLSTQVLNLNIDDPDLSVQHKITIEYIRDEDLQTRIIPLYQGAVEGFKALGTAQHYGVDESIVDVEHHGEGCSVGSSAVDGSVDRDTHGQEFTAHWVVEPGREVNTTLVTEFFNLPFDTRVHYIAVHLHPFAESLELIDRTTGETIFRSMARNSEDKIGLEEVEYFSSVEGVPVFKDHEYELVSVYNNTSGENQDSMAVMFLYLEDIQFKKPDLGDF